MASKFSQSYIEALAHKLRHGVLNPREQADFDEWYNSHDDSTFMHTDANRSEKTKLRMLASIKHRLSSRPKTRTFTWKRLVAAAVVLIVASVSLWIYSMIDRSIDRVNIVDIAPGGNRATLTLADGRTIALSSNQMGIRQLANGITYADGTDLITGNHTDPGPGVNHHTLATPKGGTYALKLPDGSQVWLNAASTLRYPSKFDDSERVVEITGEGYFSVVKDNKRPFRVVSAGQNVEVLGTEFNISAYPDEAETKTTLIEGKVNISNLKSYVSSLLTPGQQAIVRGVRTQIQHVDTEPYIAWKEGTFNFSEETLESIMRKVARWYDVEVTYSDPSLKRISFEAILPRYVQISELLDILEKAGAVSFEVSERTIHVKRKHI